MSEINKEFLSTLSDLKLEEVGLKHQIKVMVVKLIEMMKETDTKKVESEYGKFSLIDYEKYIYPSEILEAEADLKLKKLDAIRTGEAKVEVSKVLKIFPAKKNEQ